MRVELKRQHLRVDNWCRSIAAFAQAGVNKAATPRDVPMCVLNFAYSSFGVWQLGRKPNLFNVYHRQTAKEESDTEFIIEEGNEAGVSELWN